MELRETPANVLAGVEGYKDNDKAGRGANFCNKKRINMTTADFINLNTYAFGICMMALAAERTMLSEKEIFGFIPPAIERVCGVDSLLYKLATCPVCLAGQTAFLAGFFVFYKSWPVPLAAFSFHFLSVCFTIFWARVGEKWFNA